PGVPQDPVRLQLPRLEDRFAPRARLADRLDVALLRQQEAQAGADDGVVVDDQDTDRARHTGDVTPRPGQDPWKAAAGLRLRGDPGAGPLSYRQREVLRRKR